MSVITTGAHPKALWPGVKVWWGKVYNEHPPEWKDLVDVMQSDKAYEEFVQDVGFDFAAIKPQGMPITFSADQQGFVTRLVNVTIALGYICTMEEIEDNLYEKVSMSRAAINAFSMRQTKEYTVANMYSRAFTAGFVGADGQTLCSSAHPRIFGGTYSNLMVTPSDISEDSLEDAVIDIMGFANDRGMPVAIMPRSVHVARQQWFNAQRTLKSVYQPGTANNDVNILRAENVIPGGVKLNHFFSLPNAWFVRNEIPATEGGLVLLQRKEPTFDQDNDFDTKNAKAATVERYSVGWADPRAIYGVNVA